MGRKLVGMFSLPESSGVRAFLRSARIGVLSVALFLSAQAASHSEPQQSFRRSIPAPLTGHPGNIFLEGETVRIPATAFIAAGATRWRLLDDRRNELRKADFSAAEHKDQLDLGTPGVGWYRLEFDPTNNSSPAWTTLAVLPPLKAPVPMDSPVCLDTASAWFARDNVSKQRQFANLAALAGVNWVRDRLRWRDLQPEPGALKPPPTTYDTSAQVFTEAGLQVLQVFHDTPPWAAEGRDATGRFAPDLRHIYEFARVLGQRFKGTVSAWEPWNEANISVFGGHSVDELCSWQKAAWLGFKAADTNVIVGWNVTTTLPTIAQTRGLQLNRAWPYYDTYNIHTYEWPHIYPAIWKPAREAAAGRPLWITEADRGTPHLKNPPWYDQDPELELRKAEWLAQSFATSIFGGATRHFHFILGNYQEGNNTQFGLLREDLTPRPAYVALAAVGRWLAGAQALGRWMPGGPAAVYAFRSRPNGQERDVLVAWAEIEGEWKDRGKATAPWPFADGLPVQSVTDYLGRPIQGLPKTLTSTPVFVALPRGAANALPLEPAPDTGKWQPGEVSSVVLQAAWPPSALRKVQDIEWSEAHVPQVKHGETLTLTVHVYNFAEKSTGGTLRVLSKPEGWTIALKDVQFMITSGGRATLTGDVCPSGSVRDDWVVLEADCGQYGRPVLAFRIQVAP